MVAMMMATVTLSAKSDKQQYVATWTTAIQKVEPHNLAPAPYLAENSLRQIVEVSFGGKQVALKLSNEFNTEETEILGVELAEADSQGATSDIKGSSTPLTFSGRRGVTMKPGEVIVSDPVPFKMTPRMNVAITIHFGKASNTDVTGHPGSRTSSYIAKGDTKDFKDAVETAHWYYINSLLVATPKGKFGSVAAIGNSITDGRGTTTNGQNRWTDVLSKRLLNNKKTKNLSVLNLGLGGNCVLRGGLGPTANSRFERDVLKQEGVNDLGGARDGEATAKQLIESFKKMIGLAHAKGIKIYGGTIMPFKGNGYYNESREKGRQMVNEWIRTSGEYDGVIDFDAYTRDPNQEDRLNPDFLFENDWLHPNANGYQKMGSSIDLNLFTK